MNFITFANFTINFDYLYFIKNKIIIINIKLKLKDIHIRFILEVHSTNYMMR